MYLCYIGGVLRRRLGIKDTSFLKEIVNWRRNANGGHLSYQAEKPSSRDVDRMVGSESYLLHLNQFIWSRLNDQINFVGKESLYGFFSDVIVSLSFNSKINIT